MRLLFIADGRSSIALNWIDYFIQNGHEVHMVSTFPALPEKGLASFTVIPVAFSSLKRGPTNAAQSASKPRLAIRSRTLIRQWLGPLTLKPAASRLQFVIRELKPDLVHAMRIPYEGMLAALALTETPRKSRLDIQKNPPLLISVWGNDFTLHAASTPFLGQFTRLALKRTTALHTDCYRDQSLALKWGFEHGKPGLVVPGAGGVQSSVFFPPRLPVSDPLVINPRGFRAYVNNIAFFKAAVQVINSQPEARFFCPGMESEPQALYWVKKLGIALNFELMPIQSRAEMASLFRQSRLTISPSNHDGTPNTLLEAMACGCLPIAGDLESVREWLTHEENGLLVNPNNPKELAQAILRGFEDDSLQQRARRINSDVIATRAEYTSVMKQVQIFYQSIIQ